jgi:hypothetical protein
MEGQSEKLKPLAVWTCMGYLFTLNLLSLLMHIATHHSDMSHRQNNWQGQSMKSADKLCA